MPSVINDLFFLLTRSVWEKRPSFIFILLTCAIAATGCLMLYSASGGDFHPWAYRHATRFALALAVLYIVSLVDLKTWFSLAYPAYAVSVTLLFAVEVAGDIGMGAQRWFDLGLFSIQPSEMAKVALVLALARLFDSAKEESSSPKTIAAAIFMICVPVVLVLKQPDLGTAILLSGVGFGMMFVAGAKMAYFVSLAGLLAVSIPFSWSALRDYQKDRIMTFLYPERDPLGAGYHILQSKIALGSGGVFGKGLLMGSQSQLDFLPEKHTDFIFTALSEEFGMVGGVFLLSMYLALVFSCMAIGFRANAAFSRMLAFGVGMNLFLYVFVNVSMVTGILPVVGIPLPLVSYGGTSMLTVMFALGLAMCVHVHSETAHLSRRR